MDFCRITEVFSGAANESPLQKRQLAASVATHGSANRHEIAFGKAFKVYLLYAFPRFVIYAIGVHLLHRVVLDFDD